LRPLGTRPALVQATAALSYRWSSGSMQHTRTGSSLTFLRKPYDIQRNRQPSRPPDPECYHSITNPPPILPEIQIIRSDMAQPTPRHQTSRLAVRNPSVSHGRRHPHRTARPTPVFQALQPPSPQSLLTTNLGSSGEMTKQFAIDSEPSSPPRRSAFPTMSSGFCHP
jgi:hypothetical protein